MPKKKKKVTMYRGTVTATFEVEIGGVPAKNEREASSMMRAMAEAGVALPSKCYSISLWRRYDGIYETFGRGTPTIKIKHPDMMYGVPQTEVVDIDEDDDDAVG